MIQLLRSLYHSFLSYFRFFSVGGFEWQYFPFDISAPLPISAIVNLNEVLANFASTEGLTIRVTDGTLLGLYRNGCLIPHDNDLDFDVFFTSEQLIDNVRKFAKEQKWRLGRASYWNKQIQQLVFYDNKHVIYDFLFWRTDDSITFKNYAELGFVRRQDRRFCEMSDVYHVAGYTYLVPKGVEEWLCLRYGPDWQTPKNSKGAWIDDCFDIERI